MSTFRELCKAAADEASVDVEFYDARGRASDAFHDDGALHVTQRGIRAAFVVGQDNGKWTNEATRTILKHLGREKDINSRTLADEDCEDCDGYGTETGSCGFEHPCDACDGSGMITPEE